MGVTIEVYCGEGRLTHLVARAATKVCPTVEDGPKRKLAFRYPVKQFSSDFHEIL